MIFRSGKRSRSLDIRAGGQGERLLIRIQRRFHIHPAVASLTSRSFFNEDSDLLVPKFRPQCNPKGFHKVCSRAWRLVLDETLEGHHNSRIRKVSEREYLSRVDRITIGQDIKRLTFMSERLSLVIALASTQPLPTSVKHKRKASLREYGRVHT